MLKGAVKVNATTGLEIIKCTRSLMCHCNGSLNFNKVLVRLATSGPTDMFTVINMKTTQASAKVLNVTM